MNKQIHAAIVTSSISYCPLSQSQTTVCRNHYHLVDRVTPCQSANKDLNLYYGTRDIANHTTMGHIKTTNIPGSHCPERAKKPRVRSTETTSQASRTSLPQRQQIAQLHYQTIESSIKNISLQIINHCGTEE